ncbi:MAG: hydroxymethylbilane synthase [Chloroflexota bacterium]
MLAIGTRASALAMVQATILRDALTSIEAESRIVTITTDGDVRAPDTAWGEGAFVTAIEMALVEGRIDVAIHSAKDVPTEEDPRLTIAAYLQREDPRDALVVARSAAGDRPAMDLVTLPVGSRVGTDSPRRTAFLLARRPDLQVHPIHGNVDTRLRRLDEGETDALVLASAGLNRLGLEDRISSHLDASWIPPAPGQGALAVQVRTDDATALDLLSRLDHAPTRRAVELERAILTQAGGGCRAPLGVLVVADGEGLAVTAGYARPGGGLATMTTRRVSEGAVDGLAASIVDELAARATLLAQAGGAPRVLVTRAADRWAPTALALVDHGLAPLLVPCIEVESAPNDELDAAVGGLDRPDPVEWVVLTSVSAVQAIVATAGRLGVTLAPHPLGPRWAAIGRATAAAMRGAGIEVDLQPAHAAGPALAASLPIQAGTRVLLPRGDLADEFLPSALAERGAVVTEVLAYRTTEAPVASIPLLEAALAEAPAAIVATSGSTLRGLLALGAAIGAEDRLRGIALVTIGSSTAAEADRLGFAGAREAASPDPAGIADAVAELLLEASAVR